MSAQFLEIRFTLTNCLFSNYLFVDCINLNGMPLTFLRGQSSERDFEAFLIIFTGLVNLILVFCI